MSKQKTISLVCFLLLMIIAGIIAFKARQRELTLINKNQKDIQSLQQANVNTPSSGINVSEAGSGKNALIRGTLLSIDNKQNNTFLTLKVPYSGQKVNLRINFGESDFLVSEHHQSYAENKLNEEMKLISVRELEEKYKNFIGKEISVRMLLSPVSTEKIHCNEKCQRKKLLVDRYVEENAKIINFQFSSEMETGIGTEIGQIILQK